MCNRNQPGVVGQLHFKNKVIEKEIIFVVTKGRGGEELDEGASPMVQQVKKSACNAGDAGGVCTIPGLGRDPAEGNGNLL